LTIVLSVLHRITISD